MTESPQRTTLPANRFGKAVSRPALPALLLSLALHGVAFSGAVFVLNSTRVEEPTDPVRVAGIAVIDPHQPATGSFVESSTPSTDVAGKAADVRDVPTEVFPTELPADLLSGGLPGPKPFDPSISDGKTIDQGNASAKPAPVSESTTPASATASLAAPPVSSRRPLSTGPKGDDYRVTTEYFGIPGNGNKFVYVVDRSGSMSEFGGRPMQAAKAQLIRSLSVLQRVHQFQIVFYNQRPSVYRPRSGSPATLQYGGDSEKAGAQEFIDRILPSGGTDHRQALRLALSLQPDVIYLLTDANEPQLSRAELSDIQDRNRSNAVIHTVEFGKGEKGPYRTFLQDLAEQNRGQYVYVDITREIEIPGADR